MKFQLIKIIKNIIKRDLKLWKLKNPCKECLVRATCVWKHNIWKHKCITKNIYEAKLEKYFNGTNLLNIKIAIICKYLIFPNFILFLIFIFLGA